MRGTGISHDGYDHVFQWEQLGDLRYSFINWTTQAELSSSWLRTIRGNPLTGEIISATPTCMVTCLTVAPWGADIVDLLNGRVSEGDIINGAMSVNILSNSRQRRHQVSDETMAKYEALFDERTSHE